MADVTISVIVALPASLAVGQTAQAVARIATDVNDSALDTKPVVWSSSAPTVASVDVNGLVRAVAAGTASIRAAVGTVVGAANLTVSVPFVDISAAQATAISGFPVGSQFVLREVAPGIRAFTVAVSA